MAYIDEETLKTIGIRCLKIREDYKEDRIISQRDFEDILGISYSRISLIENGKAEMTMTELQAYQEITGYSYDYLMGKSECKEANNKEINKRLGLNDKAISGVEERRDNTLAINTINFLLASNSFWELVKLLAGYHAHDTETLMILQLLSLKKKKKLPLQQGIKEAENAGDTARVKDLKLIDSLLKSLPTYYTHNKKLIPSLEDMIAINLFQISEKAKEIAEEYKNDSTDRKKKK